MGRYIPFGDDLLDRIRKEIDLRALIGEEVELKRAGANFVGLCPFHEEKTPSFTVLTGKNRYRCYGCGAGGDAIEWLRKRRQMSFQGAVIHLAGMCGLVLGMKGREKPEDQVERKRRALLFQALSEAVRLYTRGLAKSPAARRYLERRGISTDSIDRFGLGVVGRGVIDLLSRRFGREALVDSGLAVQRDDGEIYDRFRHRIMFPIHNETGNLVGFAGRSMLEKPDKTAKYMNSPETEIFQKGRELYGLHLAVGSIRKTAVAVIVEGYFDVISLHQAGELRAVAPMGTALTNQQARRVLAHADTIVIAFDGDVAGQKAALAAAWVLLAEMKDGKTCKFVVLPEGEDPDTLVRRKGLGGWLDVLEAATPLSTLLGDLVGRGLERAMPESQVKAATKAKAILARTQAELFRRAMQRKFEDLIGVVLD